MRARADVLRHVRTGVRRLRRPTAAILLTIVVGAPLAALAGSPDRAGRLCYLATFFGGLLLVLLSVSDGPGPEYRSGVALLWLQKRGSLVRFYALRFAGRVLAGWSALLLVSVAASVTVLVLGLPGGGLVLRMIPALLVASLVAAAVVHAVSGLGAGRDAFAAMVVLGGLGLISVGAVMSPAESPVVQAVVSGVALPIDQIDFIGRWDFSASEGGPIRTAAHLALYVGGWLVLGSAGVWWAEHRRIPGEDG